jgi:Holliday junction resolvase RusA-like endonuclease
VALGRAAVIRAPITIILLGEPLAFARTRTSRAGMHYTPAPQRNHMAAMRMAAQAAMLDGQVAMLDEPVRLDLLAELGIPGSWSKRKHAAALLGLIRPGKRPDLDNVYKLAADSLCGVAYRDDALVCEMWCRKVYGAEPKIVCTIRPIFGTPAVKPPRANAAHRPAELPLVLVP